MQMQQGFKKSGELSIQLNINPKAQFENAGVDYTLCQKRVKAGELVELPVFKRKNTLALVAAVPVSTLDAARDLRPSVTYKATEAENAGNGQAEEKWEKAARSVEGTGDAIVWTFQVGLASKYGLEIRYSNPSDRRNNFV